MHLENIRCALLDHNLVFSRFNWVPMVCGAPEKIGSPLQEMNQILMFQRWSKFEFLEGGIVWYLWFPFQMLFALFPFEHFFSDTRLYLERNMKKQAG